ncbi:MAG: DNA polymerase III subunit delta' [Synechococcus sp. SB0676_bin_10]|uniref:DNA polymerase III subunit delta n=1 Tax=Synechococcus sp. SB0676_bin_10 TaxID=2604869 RepID=A0A6B1FAX5_9SYNE|nr:DNA polymerase III subunit delta' [Cyanobacteria bacterium MAG IRC4_bin_6]MYG38073.1 DNA polymerase III subunit delta' [Synechococcus sp. SB0676_bin_10]MYK06534.1 DNA polymerase III subunit delta' [Synechococcus sp. SB0670_bin_20]
MSTSVRGTVFADVMGQAQAVDLLQASLEKQRLAPAYLFCGPHGVGRRRTALRFLEAILGGRLQGNPVQRRRLEEGNHPDLLVVEPTYSSQGRLLTPAEVDGQGLKKRGLPQLRLEQVRDVGRFLARKPLEGQRSCALLDGVEHLNEAAANALLKTLEEPGGGLLVLLAPSRNHVLSTILSRCQVVNFRALSPAALQQVLLGLGHAEEEGPPELLALAAGSPGELLRHRQQLQALDPGQRALLEHPLQTPHQALTLARDIAERLDIEQQLWLVGWWQQHLWRQGGGQPSLTQARVWALERLHRQLRGYVQPRLAWEVTLLGALAKH